MDKTGFIRDLIDLRGSVNLFTRPRRFGKSLNMNMLKTFFEIGTDPALFDGLEISGETALCEQYMGKYPVISVSLKDVEGTDFHTACDMLGIVVSEEARRFGVLLQSDRLTQYEKEQLVRFMKGDFEKAAWLHNSLRLLTELLCKHYGVQSIILIDEYDVPLGKAYQQGYYQEMVSLIRALFSQALKTNEIHKLVIPNKEVLGIYEKRIRSWFKVKITSNTDAWKSFCETVKTGDADNS